MKVKGSLSSLGNGWCSSLGWVPPAWALHQSSYSYNQGTPLRLESEYSSGSGHGVGGALTGPVQHIDDVHRMSS